jgi:Spy/CpxP family protein refolding chaperone
MGQGMMMGGMMGQGMMGWGMTQMMGQGMGMLATGGPGPAMILRLEEPLDLTGDQVRHLEEIRDQFYETVRTEMNAAVTAHRDARAAVQIESPDFEAYERFVNEASDHMVQAHVAMARATARAREILTGEQRQQLHEGFVMMQRMMLAPGIGAGMMGARGQPW